jgi:Lipopolysaccharide kinase (Kdo/WaaP) family
VNVFSASRRQTRHAGSQRSALSHVLERLVRIDRPNSSWMVCAELQAALLADEGLPVAAWLAEGSLSIVKTGPHRTVYRLNLAEGEFYVKHFRVPDLKALVRNAILGSPAEREWNAAFEVAALGLPTFEPAGLGIFRSKGIARDGYLVSRAISDAIPLDQFLLTEFQAFSGPRQAQVRQQLAAELGRIAATLHQNRIEHVDLHAANLLVRMNGPAQPSVSLIDLHSVRFRRIMTARAREGNLAALNQFFAGRATRSDRLRFFKAYQAALDRSRLDALAEHALRVEQRLANSAQAGWNRADRAWNRGNRHVRKLETRDGCARMLAALESSSMAGWAAALCEDPESFLTLHAVRWAKRASSNRVALVQLPGDDEQLGWLKCTREDSLTERLLAPLRFSPARRAWESGHALLRRGLDTPRPLVVVDRMHRGARSSYLLTEAIEDAIPLAEFLRRSACGPARSDNRAAIARRGRRLALQLRQLHASGFDHRDLKFPNLLTSVHPGNPRVWLLDLEGLRRWRRLPRRRAWQNLSRLSASSLTVAGITNSDRLRFLKAYLGDLFGREWKNWWRTIDRLVQRKIERNLRHQRPLS